MCVCVSRLDSLESQQPLSKTSTIPPLHVSKPAQSRLNLLFIDSVAHSHTENYMQHKVLFHLNKCELVLAQEASVYKHNLSLMAD